MKIKQRDSRRTYTSSTASTGAPLPPQEAIETMPTRPAGTKEEPLLIDTGEAHKYLLSIAEVDSATGQRYVTKPAVLLTRHFGQKCDGKDAVDDMIAQGLATWQTVSVEGGASQRLYLNNNPPAAETAGITANGEESMKPQSTATDELSTQSTPTNPLDAYPRRWTRHSMDLGLWLTPNEMEFLEFLRSSNKKQKLGGWNVQRSRTFTVDEMATRTGLEPAGVLRILGRMCEAGLIIRVAEGRYGVIRNPYFSPIKCYDARPIVILPRHLKTLVDQLRELSLQMAGATYQGHTPSSAKDSFRVRAARELYLSEERVTSLSITGRHGVSPEGEGLEVCLTYQGRVAYVPRSMGKYDIMQHTPADPPRADVVVIKPDSSDYAKYRATIDRYYIAVASKPASAPPNTSAARSLQSSFAEADARRAALYAEVNAALDQVQKSQAELGQKIDELKELVRARS